MLAYKKPLRTKQKRRRRQSSASAGRVEVKQQHAEQRNRAQPVEVCQIRRPGRGQPPATIAPAGGTPRAQARGKIARFSRRARTVLRRS